MICTNKGIVGHAFQDLVQYHCFWNKVSGMLVQFSSADIIKLCQCKKGQRRNDNSVIPCQVHVLFHMLLLQEHIVSAYACEKDDLQNVWS